MPEHVVEDRVGLAATDLAAVIADTERELFARVGTYGLRGAIYEGTVAASVDGDEKRQIQTSRGFATLTEHYPDVFWLIVGDFDAEVTLGVQANAESGDVEGSMTPWLSTYPSGYACASVPFELSERPAVLWTDEITCRREEPNTPSLHFELDLAARAPDEVDHDDLRKADELSYNYHGTVDEFSPDGPLHVRDFSETYEHSGLYVDFDATWWFCNDQIATHGVSRVEITFAERCSCPPGGHCHDRYDSVCVPYAG